MKSICIMSIVFYFFLLLGCNKAEQSTSQTETQSELDTYYSDETENHDFEQDIKEEDYPILFALNGLYGYMNKQFEVIIPPIYDRATHFSDEGYAVVRYGAGDGLWECRILNYDGKILFQDYTGGMRLLYGDVVSYERLGKKELHRIVAFKENRTVIDSLREDGRASDDGIIMVHPYGTIEWKFVDYFGERVLPNIPLDRWSNTFREGRAVINEGPERHYIIDIEGTIIGNREYYRLGDYFSEGLLPAMIADGTTGYINRNGDFVFTVPLMSEFHAGYIWEATDFQNGYALIKTKEEPSMWRIINNRGEYVSDELSLYDVSPFSDGLSCVRISVNEYGYINTKGEMVIEPVFKKADGFHKGYARMIYQGRDGIINIQGQIFWTDEIVKGSG